MISHIQLLFPGYRSGNEGLVIVPLVASMMPPQASVEQRERQCVLTRSPHKNNDNDNRLHARRPNVAVQILQ